MNPPQYKPKRSQPGERERGKNHPGWRKGYIPDPFDPAFYDEHGRLTEAGVLDILFWIHLTTPDETHSILPCFDDVRKRLIELLPNYPDYRSRPDGEPRSGQLRESAEIG